MNGPLTNAVGSAYARHALLPEGFRDLLAPAAEHEAAIVRGLMDCFASYGYDRVAPPVVEYEDSLLSGAGATRAKQMFRLMDPDTQRMMAVRADMTVQTARLAATRLADAERPLRLSYAGNVLRTKGSQIRPTRQFAQSGIELIGSQTLDSELEVIRIAVAALSAAGLGALSVDLTLAPLVAALCDKHRMVGQQREDVITALDAKDSGAFSALTDSARLQFETLLAAAGPAGQALEVLTGLSLEGAAGQLVARLKRLVERLEQDLPNVSLTVDPCESHGFEYKTGIGFALFAVGAQAELGRGGRYTVFHPDGHEEPATGFSIYLDSLVEALPKPNQPVKIYVPHGTPMGEADTLRNEGWRTIQGLTAGEDASKEAARLGCSHILLNGAAIAL